MANISTFLTTSFHTKLTFMDADSEENLEEEEDDYDEDEDDEENVHRFSSSGIFTSHFISNVWYKNWLQTRIWSFDKYLFI